MKEKFYIACVLYNKPISRIASLDTFLKFKDKYPNVDIIIADNSDKPSIKLESEDQQTEIIYINNNGNLGLSRAYNRILEKAGSDDFWIMISDDDTCFSMEYLQNAYEAAERGNSPVISGIVRAGGKIMSPLRKNAVRLGKTDYISLPGIYSNIYCINSGLVVKSNVFRIIGTYDETLFLDMIDYWFMDKLIEHRINNIEIVEGDIEQSFSATNYSNMHAVRRRFAIYSKDFSTYCKLTEKKRTYKWGILAKRYINITIISRLRQLINDKRKVSN